MAKNLWSEELANAVRSSKMMAKSDPPTVESALRRLLHRLWCKAKGGPDYNKKEWMALQSLVEAVMLLNVSRDATVTSWILDLLREAKRPEEKPCAQIRATAPKNPFYSDRGM